MRPVLGVDVVRVGFEVGAEFLLQLAVAEEVFGGGVFYFQECPDFGVGEVYAEGAEGVGDLLRAVQV